MTKTRKLKPGIKWGLGVIVTAVIVTVVALQLNVTKVKPAVTWELGTPIALTGDDFFSNLPKDQHPVLVTDLSTVDVLSPGETTVTLIYKDKQYTSVLKIVDTTAPVVTAQSASVEIGTEADPNAFIASVTDLQTTTVSFKSTPNFSSVKTVTVTLVVSDASGNKTEVTAEATVVNDLTPPVITELHPLYVELNSSNPDYWAYTEVTDEKGTVSSTSASPLDVNLTKVGIYTVTLTALDDSENARNMIREVHVVMRPTYLTMMAIYDPENNKAEALAQGVYDEIITDGMTQREKMRAVYDYLIDEMVYRSNYSNDYNVDSFNKMDDYAYLGFSDYYGNCFNYASMSAILLEKIGLEVTLIKGEGYSATAETHFVLHYWILVNVDGKVYHFDPLYEWLYLRVNKQKDFFLVKDAQVYDLTHRWDTSLYPVSPK